MTLPSLMAGAEPFFFRGEGDTACLCLHGFTASPDEMRWLGHALGARGITAYGPRLPGHGTDYRHLARMRWQDWYYAALDGYHLLRQQGYTRLFVAGLSLGGLLALLLASSDDLALAGVIALAPPLQLRPAPLPLESAHRLKWFMPYTKQPDKSDLPQRLPVEQRARGFPVVGRVRYEDWSSFAAAELHKATLLAHDALTRITLPSLFVFAANDDAVDPVSARIVTSSIASGYVQVEMLQKSGHIVTQDVECDYVFQVVGEFIQQQR